MAEYQAVNQKNLSNANFAQEQAQRDADRAQSAESENKLRQYQKEVEEYSGNISVFQAQLNRYSQEVNKEVSEFQQNLNKSIQLYQAETSNQLSQYNSDIQNELNDFNKENAVYQSTVQKAMQDAQMAQAKADGDARHELDKYVQKINKYNSEVSYYAQQVNKEISEFTNNMRKEIDLYNSESQNILAKHQANVAGVADENAKKLTEYTSKLGLSTQVIGELRNQYQIISLEYNKAVASFLGISTSERAR